MLTSRFSPFNDFDHTHPLLSYALHSVPGGRTPEGLVHYSNKALWILAALLFGGLFALLLVAIASGSTLDGLLSVGIAYSIFATLISLFAFPIVDFVTVFYAVNSIRSDIDREVKFDLLRITPVPPATYASARVALARVQAWRVFVLMWQLRLLCCVLLVAAAGVGLFVSPPDLNDSAALFAFSTVLLGAGVAFVMFIGEPLWRFRYFSTLGASFAVRFRNPFTAWLWTVVEMVSVTILGGVLFLAITLIGMWVGGFVQSLMFDALYGSADVYTFTWAFSILGYALLPIWVRSLLQGVNIRRERELHQHIFQRMDT